MYKLFYDNLSIVMYGYPKYFTLLLLLPIFTLKKNSMAKLEFKVTANTKPVDDLHESIDRLEKQVKGLGKTDFSLDNWTKQFEKFKRELKEKADEIERVKAQITSFNNWDDKKGLDNLAWQLNTAKNGYYALAEEAVNTANTINQNFKTRIFEASQAVNMFTEDIINQKGTIKEIEVDVRKLGEAYRDAAKNTPMSAASKLSEYSAARKSLEEERAALFQLTQEQAKARLSVRELTDQYNLYNTGSTKVVSANEDIAGSLKQMVLTIAGADAIKDFLSSVLSVAGDFQKMEAVLTNTLGSSSKAKEAMDMLADFGATTPFQVNELTNSFVKLANQGFTPSAEEMRKLGDLASATGKSFDQLSEAILDAQTGEFERLKEFGIRASKNGDQVTFSFKEQETTVKNTSSAIREYILSLGDLEGVVGANEKIAATFAGRLSNIKDQLAEQFRLFGEAFNSELSLGIDATAAITKNLNNIIPVITGVITAYGAYRAAVLVVNAVQEASNIKEMTRQFLIHTKSLSLAEAAQKAFSLSSKAMVWPALISLVLGLGTAVYMYVKNAKEATDAQKRISDASKDYQSEITRETHIVGDLFGKLKKAKEGTTEYSDAKQKILNDYGKYLSGMNTEIATLKDQEGAYNAVTEAIKRSIAEKMKEKFINEGVGDSSAKQAEALKAIRGKIYKDVGSESGEAIFDNIKEALSKTDLDYLGIVGQLKKAGVKDDAFGYGKVISDAIVNFRNAEQDIKQVFKDADDLFTQKEDKLKTIISPNITQEIADATKKVTDLKQQIADLRSGKGKTDEGKTVEETINAKISNLNAAEKALETLTGRDKDAAKKAADEQKKRLEQQKAIDGQLLELRRQNQQAEIDLLEEGSEKRIAQIEYDYDSEIAVILAKEKEWKDAQGDKLTEDQTKEIHGALTNAYVKKFKGTVAVDKEQRDAEKKAMDEYLAQYGDYQEKRLAIIEKYNDLIAKATTEGDRLSLGKEMTKALSDLDMAANKTTSAISQLFGDMSEKTVKDMRDIASEGKKALEFLKNGQWDATTGVRLGISEETFNTLKDSPDELEAIAKGIGGVSNEADQCDNAFAQMDIGLKKIFNSKGNEKDLIDGMEDLREGFDKAMKAAQFLSDSLSSLSDSFDSEVLSGMAEGLNVAMDAANSAMQGAKAGAMFGPIGAAAGAAVGAVTSLISSFAKIHDAKNERRIEHLQDQIEVLDKSYEKLGDSVEKAYSKDASGLIDQQNKLLEQKQALIKQQIMEEKAKKKTDDDKVKEMENQLDDINKLISDNKEKAKDAIFGEDLKSAIDNFASAYAEAWASNEDRAKSAKDTVKNMMRQMVTESIKAAMDSSGAMEMIRTKLEEFYADNILQGWEQDYIYNMAEGLQRELDDKYGWADSLMRDDTEPKDGVSGQLQAAMTEGTASQLVGLWNSTSIDMRELKQISLSNGETVSSILSEVTEMIRQGVLIEQNTRRGADNTDGLINELQSGFNALDSRLSNIERNTKTSYSRG